MPLLFQARNRSQGFGGSEIVATAVSKKGATIPGADMPEKLIYFWPSTLDKNVTIF